MPRAKGYSPPSAIYYSQVIVNLPRRITGLHLTAHFGVESILKLLLQTGKVEADSKDEYGRTPLSWAARSGHEAVVKLLLEIGKVEADSKDKDSQTLL